MELIKVTIFSIFLLSGCVYSDRDSVKGSETEILSFYYSYIDSIETSTLHKKYRSYYSNNLSNSVEEETGKPVTFESLAWDMASSYMPKKFIERYYINNLSSKGKPTCFTLIGKSFDGNPMFINFSLIREAQQWKLDKVYRKAFVDNVEPSFPDKATCAEST